MTEEKQHWEEDESEIFARYGEIYVPDRETQHQIILQLLSSVPSLQKVIELGCGEGLLSEKVLKQFPDTAVVGMDLSPYMLEKTRGKLNVYENRFTARSFDLAAKEWRSQLEDVDAIISSLAIHHLDDAQKRSLYKDLYNRMTVNAMIIVADIISPLSTIGYKIAADLWDKDVRSKATLRREPKAYKIFREDGWNYFRNPGVDPIDTPSALPDQLLWLREAGFEEVDVYWMFAGHAIFAGRKYGS